MKIIYLLITLFISTDSPTKESVYEYLVSIDCKYPDIVTAQSVLETGHYQSYSCRTRHNLFGLRYNHKYLIFDNWRESCDAYMSKIQYKYKGGDYYEFLEDMGYAVDTNYIYKLKRFRK